MDGNLAKTVEAIANAWLGQEIACAVGVRFDLEPKLADPCFIADSSTVYRLVTFDHATCNQLPDDLEPYGRSKAKVSLEVLKRLAGHPQGKCVDVTAITPTPLGEGKTPVTVDDLDAAGAMTIILKEAIKPTIIH